MNKLLKLTCATIMLVASSYVSIANAQSTLHDLITDTSCTNACFYGIEPGASSSSDVETVLTNLNLTYDLESTPGYDISGVYTVDISSMSTSIKPIGDVRIFVNSDDTVLIITFSISDTPVATIVEQFGPPTRLITPSGFDTWIVYTNLGIVLSTDSNGANPQSISEVELRTPELTQQAFLVGNPYPDGDSCEDYGIFCDIAARTPTPIASATFTTTPTATATDLTASNGVVGMSAAIELAALGVTLTMAEIYNGVIE